MRGLAMVLCALTACRFNFDASNDRTGDASRPVDADNAPIIDAPTSALIAHLAFDDDPTDGALDSSGNGHTGTCTSCPALDVGHIGGAYRFDGNSNLIRIASTPELEPTGAITVAAWVNRTAPVGAAALIGKVYGAADLNSWQLRLNAQLLLEACTTADPATSRCDAVGAISRNAWHHIAYVWTGTVHRAYLDGLKVVDQPVMLVEDHGDVIVGADIGSGAPLDYLTGLVDEVWIYNVALRDADIAALAAQ